MSVSFDPIASWFVVVAAAVFVTVLTVWAYAQRLRGTSGRWRWFALGLRLAAVLLCVLAALRPSIIIQEKKKQPAALVFLTDLSTSMQITDEAGGKSRWEASSATLEKARPVAKNLGPNLEVRYFGFDSTLHEMPEKTKVEPKGRETALGAAMVETLKRLSGVQIASLVILSDGSNNAGINPLVEASRLHSQQVPVIAVGFGSENAGPASKDISIRNMTAGPNVFVKNKLLIGGSLAVRGFANQPIEVALYVDDQAEPVAKTRVRARDGAETVPITGLSFIPQTPGEKRLTLKVEPKEGELNRGNNEYTTFITAQAGGLNVLFVQGPTSPWEQKFWLKAVEASPDIQGDLRILRKPAQGETGELDDPELAPGKYNVYVLSNLAPELLTRRQQQMLADNVEKHGAGLIMLGGRFSFGSGGWADTPLAKVLPVAIHPGDGQIEPQGGVRFQPNTTGLDSYIFQVGPNREASRRIWNAMPPMTGTNRLGVPKPAAVVLARSGDRSGEPVMVSGEPGRGRVLAFGGETWVWARASDEAIAAHRKFWRQVIFWLSHKEDQGDDKVKLTLDRRRLAVGEKLGILGTARDAKNAPIPGVEFRTEITREKAGAPPVAVDNIRLYIERDEARGAYPAVSEPGIYKATLTAVRDGKDVGKDSAHFLVYQDDRELENPAADLAQLRQIAELTGGKFLPPEGLNKYLQSLNGKIYTESLTQVEHKIWDNWPFFLIFTAILTLEWWLRKRHGWV